MHSTFTIPTYTRGDLLNIRKLQVTITVAIPRVTGLRKKIWPWQMQSRKIKVKTGKRLLKLFLDELMFNASIGGKKF